MGAASELVNPSPTVQHGMILPQRDADVIYREALEEVRDDFDALEVYDLIKGIKDPEHPNTLEQLRVVDPDHISVDDATRRVRVQFTPTVPHCSMTTLIGLCIRVKLSRCLPQRFKIDVQVAPGTHDQEIAVNKQLADKERVTAALENRQLIEVLNSCLADVL